MTKPSWNDAPEWATHLAQDESGRWYWFPQEPNVGGNKWRHNMHEAPGNQACWPAGRSEPNVNWQNTLEARHNRHKEPTMTLNDRINQAHDLLDQVSKLLDDAYENHKRQAETQEREVGPEHVGRLVMVRDGDTREWGGPDILESINDDTLVPFETFAGEWVQAKFYTGPTRPNWIEHDGNGVPDEVSEAGEALTQDRDGDIDVSSKSALWWETQHSDHDIMRYTIIEP